MIGQGIAEDTRFAATPEHAVETLRAMLAGLQGLEGAEIVLRTRKALTLEAQSERIESRQLAQSQALGLRLQRGARVAQSFTASFDVVQLREAVKRCEALLEVVPEDPYVRLEAMPFEGDARKGSRLDPVIGMTPEEEKRTRLLNLEAKILRVDPRLKRVRNLQYSDVLSREWIWTLGSRRTLMSESNYAAISAIAVAEHEGRAARGWSNVLESEYYDLDWDRVGREAASFALRQLDARSLASGDYRMIFHRRIASELVELLGQALSGHNLNRGLSWLKPGDLGQQVFPHKLSLLDDPLQRKRAFAAAWDAEGVPTQRMFLIDHGQVQHFAHNRASARQAGTSSTGHALRGSERVAPTVGYRNLFIEPGDRDFVDLLRDMDRGFVVEELMGMHTANPVTGEFSVGAAGTWVEGGREQHAVRGVLIAGNLRDLFASLVGVGRDFEMHGSVGAPSLLFEKLRLSGET